MGDPLRVTLARLTLATSAEAAKGLIGFVAIVINDAIGLDGVALRRGADGQLLLAFPKRKDRWGRSHPVARPMDARARAEIEAQVFRKLGLDRDGGRRGA